MCIDFDFARKSHMASELLKSQRNKVLFKDKDSFIYRKDGQNKTKTKFYWRCLKKGLCNARCKTDRRKKKKRIEIRIKELKMSL